MTPGETLNMWDTIAAYLFCLVAGLAGLGAAGYLVVTGQIFDSLDTLFFLLASLLLAVVCLGYLAWQVFKALSENNGK